MPSEYERGQQAPELVPGFGPDPRSRSRTNVTALMSSIWLGLNEALSGASGGVTRVSESDLGLVGPNSPGGVNPNATTAMIKASISALRRADDEWRPAAVR